MNIILFCDNWGSELKFFLEMLMQKQNDTFGCLSNNKKKIF